MILGDGRGASKRRLDKLIGTRDGASSDKRSAFDCTGSGSNSGAPAADATSDAVAGDETLKRRTGIAFDAGTLAEESPFERLVNAERDVFEDEKLRWMRSC
jgi:hypothetical protein